MTGLTALMLMGASFLMPLDPLSARLAFGRSLAQSLVSVPSAAGPDTAAGTVAYLIPPSRLPRYRATCQLPCLVPHLSLSLPSWLLSRPPPPTPTPPLTTWHHPRKPPKEVSTLHRAAAASTTSLVRVLCLHVSASHAIRTSRDSFSIVIVIVIVTLTLHWALASAVHCCPRLIAVARPELSLPSRRSLAAVG